MRLPFLLLCTAALAAPVVSLGTESALAAEPLTAAAARLSPREFQRWRSSRAAPAPAIPSHWAAGRIASPVGKAEAEEARAFGAALARKLAPLGEEFAALSDPAELRTAAGEMLGLADWLAATPAYGNLRLAARCQDLATVVLGKLAADTAVPLSEVESLVARLDAAWLRAPARAAILNQESGAPLFPVEGPDLERTLPEEWRNGEIVRLKHSSAAAREAFDGTGAAPSDPTAQLIRERGGQPRETPALVARREFFADDPLAGVPAPAGVAETWDLKLHGLLADGVESPNTRALRALCLFRRLVGGFPPAPASPPAPSAAALAEIREAAARGVTIVPFEAAYSSPGEAAFAKAWAPYAATHGRSIDALAWRAWSEISAGNFLDAESRRRRVAAALGR